MPKNNPSKSRYRLIVGLDFETYFEENSKYSLRNKDISTSEYVRDERFKAHGVSIRASNKRYAKWYPHNKVKAALKKYNWKKCAVLCHNTAFDGLILSHHYDVVPSYYYDSLSMARPLYGHDIGASLDAVSKYLGFKGKTSDILERVRGKYNLNKKEDKELGVYANQDVNEMWKIFKYMLEEFPLDELDLIDITIRAFADPFINVDRPRAKKAHEKAIVENLRLIKSCAKHIPAAQGLRGKVRIERIKKALNSTGQFSEILTGLGVKIPTKKSPTVKDKTIPAFAKADLEFQKLKIHPDIAVRKVVAARLNNRSSLPVTRARRLILHSSNKMRLPIMLNYCRAHTFRWSGGDKLNPQNFPRDGELRKCLIAPKGYRIVVVDSSQIEARMNAWMAGQYDLLEVFEKFDKYGKKWDPYKLLASDVYHLPINKISKVQRFVGKVGILGLGYGMGPGKYQYTLAAGLMGPKVIISLEEARDVVRIYRLKNDKIVAFWYFLEKMLSVMKKGGFKEYKCIAFDDSEVHLPNGLSLHYPDIRLVYDPETGYSNFKYKGSIFGRYAQSKIYGALFCENIVQALARVVVGEQMLPIAERYRIISMSHDEVIYVAKAEKAKEALEYGIECLKVAPDWCNDIPLNAEGGYNVRYSK